MGLASGARMPLEMVMEIFHHYLTVASGPERRHFSNTSPMFRKEAGHTTLMITPSADYPDNRTEADFVVPFSRLSEFRESVSSMGVFLTDFGTRFGNIGRVVVFAIQPQFHGDTIAEVLRMLEVEHIDVHAESTPSAFLVPFLATIVPSIPNLTSLTLNFHDFQRDLEMAYHVHATVKSAMFGVRDDEIDVDSDLAWLAEYPEEAPECGAQQGRRLADAHRTFLSGRLRLTTDRWTRGKKWQVESSSVEEDDSDVQSRGEYGIECGNRVKMVFDFIKRLRVSPGNFAITTTAGPVRTPVAIDRPFGFGKNTMEVTRKAKAALRAHKVAVKELHNAQKANIEAVSEFKGTIGWFDGFDPSRPITGEPLPALHCPD
ncbi:hypothetical protein NMY22_g9793 [Coprinellus aureogranulatus]|nr:hypothetical protein NMY22_g9793 [Coprinellus aureogranulatus]